MEYKDALKPDSVDLKDVITPETINLHLKGTTKEAIIDELLDTLVKAGKVKDRVATKACVLDRERKMSTGMKHGIAIPHGKTDSVSDLVACIGIADKTGPHLQFLAQISLLFKSAEKREELLRATNEQAVIKLLMESDEE